MFGCSEEDGPRPVLASPPPEPPAVEYSLLPHLNPNRLWLKSEIALVIDEAEGKVLYEHKSSEQRPIASLTKLMTAMVVLDAGLDSDEVIAIKKADRDRLRGSRSKLSYGTKLTRRDLLKIALAGSENRAALALARTYPGGREAFVAAMNEKARQLGLKDTEFRDPAGLNSGNLSTAADLARLADAASRYPLIHAFTTVDRDFVTDLRSGYKVRFVNTNRLVRSGQWDVDFSKTGYIADAGHCLLMRAEIADRPIMMVLLNSWGTLSKYGDANRIRKWLRRADDKARQSAQVESLTASR
jgi:D-alanyl-D-alanine endopeptidase (penicillin-binding protein 7)